MSSSVRRLARLVLLVEVTWLRVQATGIVMLLG